MSAQEPYLAQDGQPRLRRRLGLLQLVIYGIVLVQPTAPMPVFRVISVEAGGHVVSAVLLALVAMLFTPISYGRMATSCRVGRLVPEKARSSCLIPATTIMLGKRMRWPRSRGGSMSRHLPALTQAIVAISLSVSTTSGQNLEPLLPPSPALAATISAIVAQHHGRVALFAENLRTHAALGIDADRPVQTASVIKLSVLFEAMEQVRAGRITLNRPILLTKEDQVSGSGVLQFFNTPATFTLHDILMLMITQSDNTATNLAIDALGLAAINDSIQRLGLKHTWLYKKIGKPSTAPMPEDQKHFGLGKSTAREMATLVSRMYDCSFSNQLVPLAKTDEALCQDMLTMLQKQFFRGGIPRYLETGDTSEQAEGSIGNKTGALEAVRNDVGLVSTQKGPVIIAAFTYDNADTSWNSDNEGEVTIARIAKAIVNDWSPQGLNPQGYLHATQVK